MGFDPKLFFSPPSKRAKSFDERHGERVLLPLFFTIRLVFSFSRSRSAFVSCCIACEREMASSLTTHVSLTSGAVLLQISTRARRAPMSSRMMPSPKRAVVAVSAAGNGGASSSPSSDTHLSLSTSILHPEKCFIDPYNALSTPLYQVRGSLMSNLSSKKRNRSLDGTDNDEEGSCSTSTSTFLSFSTNTDRHLRPAHRRRHGALRLHPLG